MNVGIRIWNVEVPNRLLDVIVTYQWWGRAELHRALSSSAGSLTETPGPGASTLDVCPREPALLSFPP